MQATLEQLSQIDLFAELSQDEQLCLKPHTQVQSYLSGEIILHEGEQLPAKLYTLLSGCLQITKTASTGKETILRTLSAGEMFAAPAILGNGISPATVSALCDCQILTITKEALLKVIKQHPEIALQMLCVFNERLQQLHETVHGLVSERAIVRLVRLISYFAQQYGTQSTPQGQQLNIKLPYYRLARTIGITYEECVRLMKSIKSVIVYNRGKLTVIDSRALEAIASGEIE